MFKKNSCTKDLTASCHATHPQSNFLFRFQFGRSYYYFFHFEFVIRSWRTYVYVNCFSHRSFLFPTHPPLNLRYLWGEVAESSLSSFLQVLEINFSHGQNRGGGGEGRIWPEEVSTHLLLDTLQPPFVPKPENCLRSKKNNSTMMTYYKCQECS